MKVSKRRVSCSECRGLRDRYPFGCIYGYATEWRSIKSIVTASGKRDAEFPAEPCPRPRSFDEHIEVFIARRKLKSSTPSPA